MVVPLRATIRLTLTVLAAVALGGSAWAVEQVAVLRADGEVTLEGRTVVEAVDKSRIFQTADGALWLLAAEEVVKHTQDDRAFMPLAAEAAAKELLETLPAGFEVHRTKNYAICYNTNKAYAQWVGALFERLHRAFHTFWTRKGIELTAPEFPLVAVVFADERSYAAHVEKKHGKAAAGLVAFYALSTNHVTLHDLTGVGALRQNGNRRGSPAQINAMLSHEDAASNVATVVHEAFHQLAFNCGLSQRYADVPLWFAEGLAMYFETPDLSSAQGWRTIGAAHHGRVKHFRAFLPTRPADSLASLVADDRRFRDPRQNLAAYAEAWALTHTLLERNPKKYVAYLKTVAAKKPAFTDSPEERLKEFHAAFGSLKQLDAELLKHVKGLR